MKESLHQSTQNFKICFIGAGSMAEAIIRGLIENKQAKPEQIVVLNRSNVQRLEHLQQLYGIRYGSSNEQKEQALRTADIVFLAMKPKDAPAALIGMKHLFSEAQMLLSVIAGLSIGTIRKLIGKDIHIVRTMPNTSSHIGEGATGISFSDGISDRLQQTALAMFQSIGETAIVEEEQLNIVTGVSGSGPAYVYYLMEAMIAAGVKGGLNHDSALKLTIQTVLGAARMVQSTHESPDILRKRVTSPGGTTEAAFKKLDERQFSHIVQEAVLRAAERAYELGQMIDNEAVRAKHE